MSLTDFQEIKPTFNANGWTIHGDDQQVLHVPVNNGQTIYSEIGTMMYGSEHMQMKVGLYPSANGAIYSAVSMMAGGECPWVCHWTNQDEKQAGYLGLTLNLPGKMIPIGPEILQQGLVCKRGAWVASFGSNIAFTVALLNGSIGAAMCGGMDLIVQRLSSSDPNGVCFIQGAGTILVRNLGVGEKMLCIGECLLAMGSSVSCDIMYSGSCAMMMCSGAPLFNMELTGPGVVYLESFPVEKLRRLFAKKGGGKKKKDEKGGA